MPIRDSYQPAQIPGLDAARNRMLNYSENRLKALFMKYDPNGDGTGSLALRELTNLFLELGIVLTPSEIKSTMRIIDLDGNGTLEFNEFLIAVDRARKREEMKTTIDDIFHDSTTRGFGSHINKIFGEFKEKNNKEESGVSLNGLCEMLKLLDFEMPSIEIALFFRKFSRPTHETFQNPIQIIESQRDKNRLLTRQGLANVFCAAYSRRKLNRILRDINQKDNTSTVQRFGDQAFLSSVFWLFESSSEGHMSEDDLYVAVKFLRLNFNRHRVVSLIKEMDTDQSGLIELDEFLVFFSHASDIEEMNKEQSEKGQKAVIRVVIAGLVSVASLVASITLGVLSTTKQEQDTKIFVASSIILAVLSAVSLTVCFAAKLHTLFFGIRRMITLTLIHSMVIISIACSVVSSIGFAVSPKQMHVEYQESGLVETSQVNSIWFYLFYSSLSFLTFFIIFELGFRFMKARQPKNEPTTKARGDHDTFRISNEV